MGKDMKKSIVSTLSDEEIIELKCIVLDEYSEGGIEIPEEANR
jgi:hypothetical protein